MIYNIGHWLSKAKFHSQWLCQSLTTQCESQSPASSVYLVNKQRERDLQSQSTRTRSEWPWDWGRVWNSEWLWVWLTHWVWLTESVSGRTQPTRLKMTELIWNWYSTLRLQNTYSVTDYTVHCECECDCTAHPNTAECLHFTVTLTGWTFWRLPIVRDNPGSMVGS